MGSRRVLQDRGFKESRGVNRTIEFQLVLPSWGERVRERHTFAVASSDETLVELHGSGHVW